MIWKENVVISDDLVTSAYLIFGISRFFGLAPFSVKKQNKLLVIEISFFYTVYSVIILLGVVTSAILNALRDGIYSGNNQSTSKYITIMNSNIIQITIAIGILGAPFRFYNFCSFAKHISEVDQLMPPSNTKKTVVLSAISLFTVLITFMIYISCNLYNLDANSAKSLYIYIHDVLSYSIIMILECQYWYMTMTVTRRMKSLNRTLLICNFKLKSNANNSNLITSNRLTFNVNLRGIVPFHQDHSIVNENLSITEEISKLNQIYMNLCNAVDDLNGCCGLYVAIIIVIGLLHLTVVVYYIIVELENSFDLCYTILMGLLFCAFFYRLIFIIEPCEDCLYQVKQTSLLVCEGLSSSIEGQLSIQLSNFYEQLLLRKVEFSACGFGNVDRTLITTISATATVYLVAAVQFENSED